MTGAILVAEKMRVDISRIALPHNGAVVRTSASIGIVSFPDDGRTSAELMRRADLAMYEAKRRGRDQIVRFAREPRHRRRNPQTVVTSMTEASELNSGRGPARDQAGAFGWRNGQPATCSAACRAAVRAPPAGARRSRWRRSAAPPQPGTAARPACRNTQRIGSPRPPTSGRRPRPPTDPHPGRPGRFQPACRSAGIAWPSAVGVPTGANREWARSRWVDPVNATPFELATQIVECRRAGHTGTPCSIHS